ncbi:Asx homology domain-containing protein [Xylariaceae sp. FL0016]|nr:Asx homology domain-containing protein [Xylariaceae sp. FL0016]
MASTDETPGSGVEDEKKPSSSENELAPGLNTTTGVIDSEVGDETSALKNGSGDQTKDTPSGDDESHSQQTIRSPKRRRNVSGDTQVKDATPRTTRRSGRTPVKKQEFDMGVAAGDGIDELAEDQPTLKKSKITLITKSRGLPSGGRKAGRSVFDNPDHMLTATNSPLATTNLRDLLCNPMAWDVLTTEEKQKVLSKFPDDKEILDAGTENAHPDIAALRNNNNFRHDIARYQENLRNGRHDADWITQAQAAHSRRATGFYDKFLAEKFESEWGVPYPEEVE